MVTKSSYDELKEELIEVLLMTLKIPHEIEVWIGQYFCRHEYKKVVDKEAVDLCDDPILDYVFICQKCGKKVRRW